MDPGIMDQMDLVELVIPWIPERWMMDYELLANLEEVQAACQGSRLLEVLQVYLTSQTSFHVWAVLEANHERCYHYFWHRSWLFAGDYKFPMQS